MGHGKEQVATGSWCWATCADGRQDFLDSPMPLKKPALPTSRLAEIKRDASLFAVPPLYSVNRDNPTDVLLTLAVGSPVSCHRNADTNRKEITWKYYCSVYVIIVVNGLSAFPL